jgi:hypothetical protein
MIEVEFKNCNYMPTLKIHIVSWAIMPEVYYIQDARCSGSIYGGI